MTSVSTRYDELEEFVVTVSQHYGFTAAANLAMPPVPSAQERAALEMSIRAKVNCEKAAVQHAVGAARAGRHGGAARGRCAGAAALAL
jgi:hypothetical protein